SAPPAELGGRLMNVRSVVSVCSVALFVGFMVTAVSGQGSRRYGPHSESSAKDEGRGDDPRSAGQRLFERETFGGNGRTCLTCHSRKTGTVSPRDAQARFAANRNDPLFLHDGSDDGH